MSLYTYFRISKPSVAKVPEDKVADTYMSLRNRTFWGATIAYSLYYVCRMSINVVKQPLIDEGVLSAGQLGLIGSALLFVYAVGKFMNGFIADYCNIRRFMAVGLFISSVMNLVMGALGFFTGMIPSMVMFFGFAILWGVNGWMQSMGSAPGVISLSRWFPRSKRGSYYSLFSSSPYIGEFISYNILAVVVGWLGWQSGFMMAALAGFIGTALILLFVSDTPESKGLPSIQEISGETLTKEDSMPTKDLQKMVLKHPGIWVIALASAFIYITKYAIAGWGVLFLQEEKGFSLTEATTIISINALLGIFGTVLSGWVSDKLFRSDRYIPALIFGAMNSVALVLFLFGGNSWAVNIIAMVLFGISIGVLICFLGGLMAVDIVPRKATGAALGVVGAASYVAAGIQDVASGWLIDGNSTVIETLDEATGQMVQATQYDFTPVAIFWVVASVISFLLPVLNWKYRK